MRPASAKAGANHSANFERLFLVADYDRCRELLRDAPACDATTLQTARLDYVTAAHWTLSSRLSPLRPASLNDRRERDILLGIAYSKTGDNASALRLYNRALSKAGPDDELSYFALFQKALAHWGERDYDALIGQVPALLHSPFPLYRGRARILRGLISVQKRDLRAQAAEYMKALDELESMREPDMLVRLSTIFTLAALSRELPLDGGFSNAFDSRTST